MNNCIYCGLDLLIGGGLELTPENLHTHKEDICEKCSEILEKKFDLIILILKK